MFAGLLASIAFQHVILVIQENRTPDNMFYALCATNPCSDDGSTGYDIQTRNWSDRDARGKVVQPTPIGLVNPYDLMHTHSAFSKMCDGSSGLCLMDGAAGITCKGNCPSQPQFRYVDNSSGTIQPYLDLITSYGWANKMYQTNQGPSFPAHLYLFGGTSAPSADDDAQGTFAAETFNTVPRYIDGCVTTKKVQLIDAEGRETAGNKMLPCFEHTTISDLLDANSISWRYYLPNAGIWDAPGAISHICQPGGGNCSGEIYNANVDLNASDVLTDISNCNLHQVTWAIPTGANSDHPLTNDGGGPSWVASIINAIGQSSCGYWENTAIIITWDDWGGWYDHEKPIFLAYPEGGYQMGFRVPLIFVSAYTPSMIDNVSSDFGSIARFIEQNFGLTEGQLGFADSRSSSDLTEFVVTGAPRRFVPIKSPKNAQWFIDDKRPQTPPDDD